MKKNKIFSIIFFLMSLPVFAQKAPVDAGISKILNVNKLITLPAKLIFFVNNVEGEIRREYSEACEGSFYDIWDTKVGVNVILVTLLNKTQYVSIAYREANQVSGLPLGLIFNESTFAECKNNFKKYNAKWSQVVGDEQDNGITHFQLSFAVGKLFIDLDFFGEEKLLQSIRIATTKMD